MVDGDKKKEAERVQREEEREEQLMKNRKVDFSLMEENMVASPSSLGGSAMA